jgi:hypothetical protein
MALHSTSSTSAPNVGCRRRMEMVSFAHPRLAAVFASVLPGFGVDLAAVEDRLVAECEEAWSLKGTNALKTYALNWLPTHLIGQDKNEEAANLLSNGAFHLARLASSRPRRRCGRTGA